MDNTTTLLHFLAEKMDRDFEKRGEDLQNFTIADFANVVTATKVSPRELQRNMDQMKNSVKQVRKFVQNVYSTTEIVRPRRRNFRRLVTPRCNSSWFFV